MWQKLAGRRFAPASLPEGTRLYVIGDIHGRADLLEEMLGLIHEDLHGASVQSAVEIYLGDYVDRGSNSRDVIDMLLGTPVADQRICLMGNHDQIFLNFMNEPNVIASWMELGGLETLLSYGLRPKLTMRPDDVKQIHAGLLAALPSAHRQFLQQLKLTHRCGDYFFVHAGVKPGVDLEKQSNDDLLWIREPFLTSTRKFGAIVVHGHTPDTSPVVLPNRICIDTGAYITGVLTCLVLESGERRFLATSQDRAQETA